MGDVTVELRRSGFAEWTFDYLPAELLALALLPIAWLANVLTHVLVFGCGWTLHVYANENHRKVRYRRKADALADIDRQRALAAEIPPPQPADPTRLPTRGGFLRRPW
jgi:hypothetical protein